MLFKKAKALHSATVKPSCAGFTVAELVVVCGIIGLLSLVIVAGYNRYNSQSLLQSLMYEMALSVREAQVFGSAVKSESATANFNVNYGVQFTTANNGSQYFIRSRPVGSSVTTPVNTFTLSRGNRVTAIYSCPVGWVSTSTCSAQSNVFLYFKRPHFDTDMETGSSTDSVSDAFMVVVSGPTGMRTLTLYRSGRVAIQ